MVRLPQSVELGISEINICRVRPFSGLPTPPHLHGSLKRSYGDVGSVGCTHPEGPADPSHPAAAAQAANFPGISASRHAGSRGLNPARSAAAVADQLSAGFMRRHSDTATICTTLSRLASIPRSLVQIWHTSLATPQINA
ncbi:hypothetical protein MCOR24_010890 [Pyricularia oryzae]|nr:hypothetical protein MCOR24_010890 [Pyricularia oryzae]